LDLHTHSTYNLLPLWESANTPYNNRFEWRSDPAYKSDVRGPFSKINTPDYRKTLAVFSELQAVAGGTAVLQESKDLEKDSQLPGTTLVCRDTANTADLLMDTSKRIFSVVDFFRPDRQSGIPSKVDWSLKSYIDNRKQGKLLATLAHVAEGRSGVGSDRGVDRYSREEFERFMQHPAFKDAEAVKSSPFSIIHGCGINAYDSKHLEFLRKRNISIVWSPVSNLLLYGDTLDVETLIEDGVNVALGSDWSPSGSKHVWDEAKFARFYLDAIGSSISNEQIFKMVTTSAATCLGLTTMGRITPGAVADFFILRSPLETDNPLEVFFSTTDRHVLATIIGGRPIYGDRDFLKGFGVPVQRLPRQEGSAVENKGVYLSDQIKVDVQRDISRIEKLLKKLDPPVKRSNLLASSDKPYQRRIQFLKSSVARFGWSVRQWKKRGPSDSPGLVPVPPNSVRVWRGYRKSGMKSEDFGNQLGSVFIPSAVQTQVPLGMTAYLPTVLPYRKAKSVPDEIALVFYESKEVYGQTFKTTAGRAYGLLHGTVFAPTKGLPSDQHPSASGWPDLFNKTLKPNKAYYLFKSKTDWQKGSVYLYVGTRKQSVNSDEFLEQAGSILQQIQKTPVKGMDGAIVTTTGDCLIYWEHWTTEKPKKHPGITALGKMTSPVLSKAAEPLQIVANSLARSPGTKIQGGECLNLQFFRRREFPW
jgi:5-methylthioadenosine/S-adenosylhomocysteine deaminase